jgi:hypothetical protein
LGLGEDCPGGSASHSHSDADEKLKRHEQHTIMIAESWKRKKRRERREEKGEH